MERSLRPVGTRASPGSNDRQARPTHVLKLAIGRPGADGAWPDGAEHPETEVWRDPAGVVCGVGLVRDGRYWLQLPGLATFRFGSLEDEVQALPCPSVRRAAITDAYRRTVLPMALQARGTEVLHASAVRTASGVVALCGASGTGKSTIAFGLSVRGYPVWADDAVAFETSPAGVEVLPTPFKLRLHCEAASYFGVSGQRVKLTRRAPASLAAVCVLERSPQVAGHVAVELLRPSAAFPAVLAHAYCFTLRDPVRKRSMAERYLELCARVPIFRIRFAPGLKHLSRILGALEAIGARVPAERLHQ